MSHVWLLILIAEGDRSVLWRPENRCFLKWSISWDLRFILESFSLGRSKNDASVYFRFIFRFAKDCCSFRNIWIEWLMTVTLCLINKPFFWSLAWTRDICIFWFWQSRVRILIFGIELTIVTIFARSACIEWSGLVELRRHKSVIIDVIYSLEGKLVWAIL